MSESTEIAHRDETSKAIAATDTLGNVGAMLETMMMLAKDPSVDAAKFETIARVVKETREDAKKQQFYEDKAAAMFERSEEHTSELQSLMRISYAVFCLKKKKQKTTSK